MITIRRLEREDWDRSGQGPPGRWMPRPALRRGLAWLLGEIFCPKCGKLSTLSARVHTVAPDGTVAPSYVCPYPPCAFHAFVRLDGWTPPPALSSRPPPR